MDTLSHRLENLCRWNITSKITLMPGLIRIDSSDPRMNIHKNPFLFHNALGLSTNVIAYEEFEFDPSKLIDPISGNLYLFITTTKKGSFHWSLQLIIPRKIPIYRASPTRDVQSLIEQASHLSRSPKPSHSPLHWYSKLNHRQKRI